MIKYLLKLIIKVLCGLIGGFFWMDERIILNIDFCGFLCLNF